MMYKFIRNMLFLLEAERAHYFSMNLLKLACRLPFIKRFIAARFQPGGDCSTRVWELVFPNRVGLGAGFDKNAQYLNELETLGFGFVEIGTVTPRAQAGNDQPRLFRLKKDEALINRMGFNNEGVEAVANRLKKWRNEGHHSMIIGGNIGKNKITPNEEAWKDYETCFIAMYDLVDYFVVNVSSPNTPGLRALQEKDSLRKILVNLQQINRKKNNKPLLLKIAPDLTTEQVDDIIDLAMEIRLHGLVVSNTTISRDGLMEQPVQLEKIGAGGLSGRPLFKRSTELLEYIHQKTANSITLVASGGIFSRQDAEKKINAGASLIQVWTGFIYEGPGIIRETA